ncbi:MAG TPA: helix-turn-helix transcriptional regulator [Polyangiaceae bacterium]|nr:helix-turn-helix transcriptional regulator [Polyangiaceae bacterium]
MLCNDAAYCPFIHAADDSPRRSWAIPQRRLAHYLLVTSLEGSEELVVQGQPLLIARGASYLIQPGWLCDLASRGGNRPVWVHFDVIFEQRRREHPLVNAYNAELGPRESFLQPGSRETWGVELGVLVPAPLVRLYRERVVELVRTWKRGGPRATFSATCILGELLAALVEHAWQREEHPRAASTAERLTRAESVAMRSLGVSFGLDEFAAAAGLSASRFSALYRRERGTSPGAFLRRARLKAAAELLLREALPVARVGVMVGYPDPTVFGRVFKGHYGVSPAAWRKRRQP